MFSALVHARLSFSFSFFSFSSYFEQLLVVLGKLRMGEVGASEQEQRTVQRQIECERRAETASALFVLFLTFFSSYDVRTRTGRSRAVLNRSSSLQIDSQSM